MISAEFLHSNPSSADPFRDTNMRYGICRQCESYDACNRSPQMPVISHISRYIMTCHSEIENGFASYPEAGNWEHQPLWFMYLMSAFRGKQSDLRLRDQQKQQAKLKGK